MSGTIGSNPGRWMSRIGWAVVAAAALLTLGAGGCGPPSEPVVKQRDEFQQSRREAELNAQIATLEARLEQERVRLAQEQNRADAIQKDLTREKNARREEKLQLDLAIQLQADAMKQLQQSREQGQSDQAEIKRLREDLGKWRELLDRRDQELARLREQVDQLQKKLDSLNQQAQR